MNHPKLVVGPHVGAHALEGELLARQVRIGRLRGFVPNADAGGQQAPDLRRRHIALPHGARGAGGNSSAQEPWEQLLSAHRRGARLARPGCRRCNELRLRHGVVDMLRDIAQYAPVFQLKHDAAGETRVFACASCLSPSSREGAFARIAVHGRAP